VASLVWATEVEITPSLGQTINTAHTLGWQALQVQEDFPNIDWPAVTDYKVKLDLLADNGGGGLQTWKWEALINYTAPEE